MITQQDNILKTIKDLQDRIRTLELYTTSNNVGGWRQAGETWTYASADSPTFTFTTPGDKTDKYSAGMRVRLEQTTTKYFLISKDPTYSAGSGLTTVTVYGGTDYTLTSAAILRPAYSEAKTPQGFPTNPDKWTVTVTGSGSQAPPAVGTWYNLGSISITIPIGSWQVAYYADVFRDSDTTFQVTNPAVNATLSTSSSSESDSEYTANASMSVETAGADAQGSLRVGLSRTKGQTLTTKDVFYFLSEAINDDLFGTLSAQNVVIKAVSSFL